MNLSIHRYNTKVDTISARIIDTNTKYDLKNKICTFDDPDFNDVLFMNAENVSFHFGDIYNIEKSKRFKKEIWEISTSRGLFKFEILSKPQWHMVKEVKCDNEKIMDFESRAFIKNFFKTFNVDNLLKNVIKVGQLSTSFIDNTVYIDRVVNTYNN